jgi:hypothetical protein
MLNKAIMAAKAGRKAEARQLLEAVLDTEERNERAWLWLSGVVDNDEERTICLENVLSINPDNQAARRGLAMLRAAHAPIRPLPAPGPAVPAAPPSSAAAAPPSPGATASPPPGDVVNDLLGRIEQQQSQAKAARIPDNRMLILITIVLAVLLLCSVIGIVIFSMMPAS